MSIVRASLQNSTKSEGASIKSGTIIVSGFSGYTDKFLKVKLSGKSLALKCHLMILSNVLIKLDDNITIETEQ